MTNQNDMIHRGSVLERLELAEHDAEERDWRSGANEIARLRRCIAALPAVTVKPLAEADTELLFDAYKGLLVLHRMLSEEGLTAGVNAASQIIGRMQAAHPEFPARAAIREASHE